MVNITYGETYFDDNGDLLNAKIPNHNTYTIDSVEYQIFPNIGILHVLASVEDFVESIQHLLERTFHEKSAAAAAKFGPLKSNNVTNTSTQYLTVTHTNAAFINKVMFDVDDITNGLDPTANFVWFLKSGDIPISGVTKGRSDAIYSLSSIILDTIGALSLPNGYRHCDYPSYCHYAKGLKIHPDVIDYHPSYGIHRELVKHYPNVMQPTKPLVFALKPHNRPVTLVKWEWLQFYSINPDSGISAIDQVNMGLFDTSPNEEVTYKCFITNAPIYDDCYVFDIISRNIRENIKEKDLPAYLERYPDLIVHHEDDKKTKIAPRVIKRGVIKRGTLATEKTICIQYVKKYDTPRCILVSPYYMHLMDMVSPVDTFENLTETSVLIYRTKSPVTIDDAIRQSSASEETKKILTTLYDSAKNTGIRELSCADETIKFMYHGEKSISSDLLLETPGYETIVMLEMSMHK